MEQLTKELETELGPDTAELGLRIGLHSGPVVAGVLRGEKSRFQLFGDSVSSLGKYCFSFATNEFWSHLISSNHFNVLHQTDEHRFSHGVYGNS
jgi:Adenylate and Guanylate cyclase catalytic domain